MNIGFVPMLRGKIRGGLRRAEGRVAGTLTRVRTREAVAALTFDDGPHPEFTPRVVELLERHGARGTFFMLGANARAHPEVVRRVAKGGHSIGNHTWDHPSLPGITDAERRRQIRACADAVAPYAARLFRPPRTLQSLSSFLTVRSLGYEVVAWSLETQDWRGDRDAAWIADRVLTRMRPGHIVVLHDNIWDPRSEAAADRRPTLEAVEIVLDRLAGRIRFITVPELLRRGRAVREPWFVPTDDDW